MLIVLLLCQACVILDQVLDQGERADFRQGQSVLLFNMLRRGYPTQRVHQVRACLGGIKRLLGAIRSYTFLFFDGFLLFEDIDALSNPLVVKQVFHLLEKFLLTILEALFVTQEVVSDLALVLEL